jgi:hypothetical protein
LRDELNWGSALSGRRPLRPLRAAFAGPATFWATTPTIRVRARRAQPNHRVIANAAVMFAPPGSERPFSGWADRPRACAIRVVPCSFPFILVGLLVLGLPAAYPLRCGAIWGAILGVQTAYDYAALYG